MEDKKTRQPPKLKIPQPSHHGEMPQGERPPALSVDGKTVLPKIRQPTRGTPFG